MPPAFPGAGDRNEMVGYASIPLLHSNLSQVLALTLTLAFALSTRKQYNYEAMFFLMKNQS